MLVSVAARVKEGQKRGWDGGADRLWSPDPPPAWPQLSVESGTNRLTAWSAPLWNKHQYSSPASLARCSRQSRHMINVKRMNIGMREYQAGRQRVGWDGGLEDTWEITEFFTGTRLALLLPESNSCAHDTLKEKRELGNVSSSHVIFPLLSCWRISTDLEVWKGTYL